MSNYNKNTEAAIQKAYRQIASHVAAYFIANRDVSENIAARDLNINRAQMRLLVPQYKKGADNK